MRDVYLVSTVRISVSDDAPDRLEQILAYMSQHCDDASLVSVAAHFNVHPNTVSGLIRRETGLTFSEILRKMRLARATVLLRSGKVSVAQVARLCGYENPSNLYRAFKQEHGCTPREYIAQLEEREEQARKERAAKASSKKEEKGTSCKHFHCKQQNYSEFDFDIAESDDGIVADDLGAMDDADAMQLTSGHDGDGKSAASGDAADHDGDANRVRVKL